MNKPQGINFVFSTLASLGVTRQGFRKVDGAATDARTQGDRPVQQ